MTYIKEGKNLPSGPYKGGKLEFDKWEFAHVYPFSTCEFSEFSVKEACFSRSHILLGDIRCVQVGDQKIGEAFHLELSWKPVKPL